MNRSKKQKTNSFPEILATLLSGVIGAILGILSYRQLELALVDVPFGSRMLTYLCSFLVIGVACYLQILIHEAGHLLFGLLLGYRFHSFRVGSMTWIKEDGKIKFRKYSLIGTGGQCLMFLPEGEITLKTHVLYHMGGSILNAISGVLCIIGYVCCRGNYYLTAIFLMLGGMGFINALANGIPMKLSMVNNDGHNALSIARDPRGEEAFCLQMRISEAEVKGTAMKDMPDAWFSIPTKDALQNSLVANTAVLACFRMMEQRKFIEADYLMEQLLEIESGMVGYHRALLTCQRIYIETLRENRRDRIQYLLSPQQRKFMKAMRKQPMVLYTEYALALLSEGNHLKAQGIRKDFETVAKTYPYHDDIAESRSLMGLVDEKAQIYATIAQQRS